MAEEYKCGKRGCAAKTKRGGRERYCAQEAIHFDSEGRGWCYYHNPKAPKRFGEGYSTRAQTTTLSKED